MKRFFTFLTATFLVSIPVFAQAKEGLHPAIHDVDYVILEHEGACYLEEIGRQHNIRLTPQFLFESLRSLPHDHPDVSAIKYSQLLLVAEELVLSGDMCEPDVDPQVDERLIAFWNTKKPTCELRASYTTAMAADLISILDQTPRPSLVAMEIEPEIIRKRLRWLRFADCAVAKPDPNPDPKPDPKPEPERFNWRDLPLSKSLVRYDAFDIPLADLMIENQYMVFFEEGVTDKGVLAEILGISTGQITNLVTSLNAAVVQVDREIADALIENSFVTGIMQDRYGFFTASQIANNVAQDLVDQFYNGLDDRFETLEEIQPVRVYVVDGGIQQIHSEISNKVTHWRAIGRYHGGFTRALCELHGTAVASLIAGDTFGIASKVELVDVDITPCAVGDTTRFPASHILLALDWISQAQDWFDDNRPTLINMSLNVPINKESAFEKQSTVPGMRAVVGVAAFEKQVVKFLDRHPRITLVAAAGNEAKNACGFFPALMERVITVGGTTDQDTLWKSSNFGACVDTYAPAEDIAVASPLETTQDGTRVDGTSFSAAIATGVIAHRLAAGQTIEQIKTDILRPYSNERRAQIQHDQIDIPVDAAHSGRLAFLAKIPSPFRADCVVASYDGLLNLRDQSNYTSKRLRVLENGDGFKILDRSGDKWLFVELEDGLKGWVARYDKKSALIKKANGQAKC